MKGETCGVSIKGFIALKSKMYTFIAKDNHESSIKKSVDDDTKYKDYKNILFNRSYMRHEMYRIQSKDHNIRLHGINTSCFSFLQW